MLQGFAAINKRLSDRGVLAGTGHNTPLGHHTGPIGLGQYDGPGEYCGPHTASSMFLILIYQPAITRWQHLCIPYSRFRAPKRSSSCQRTYMYTYIAKTITTFLAQLFQLTTSPEHTDTAPKAAQSPKWLRTCKNSTRDLLHTLRA